MSEAASPWSLVTNVTRDPHREGPPGSPLVFGTKHFAPGAKIYVGWPWWGDGGERVNVLGRHRGGGPKLIEIVVASKHLENFRAKEIFHPHVLREYRYHWKREEAEGFAESWNRLRERNTSADPWTFAISATIQWAFLDGKRLDWKYISTRANP